MSISYKNVSKALLLCTVMLISSKVGLLYAQNPITIELKSVGDIDVCGNKEFQIYVQTNEIYALDSLVGYDLYISYNPNKIQLDQLLTANTLSSQLDNSSNEGKLTINKTNIGEVWVSGAYFTNSKFIKGKQPLIAISGRYLKNCTDTALISIEDFIPSYYNFNQPPEIKVSNLVLKAEIANIKGRELSLIIKNDTLNIFQNEIVKPIQIYLLSYNISRLSNIEFSITFDKSDHLLFSDIISLQKSFRIDTIIQKLNSVYIKASIFNNIDLNNPVVECNVKRINNDSTINRANIKIDNISDCTCIARLLEDSLVIIQEQNISTTNYDIVDSEVNDIVLEVVNDNVLQISNNLYIIDEVKVFNLLGQIIYNNYSLSKSIDILLSQLDSGFNGIELTLKTNNKNKIKLIKYIK